MKTDEIRQAYLDFFIQHEHRHAPSSPLIPHGDPTLMFTSAGMVQFKPYYSGEIDPLPFTRAVTCQKCFRAGGKDSDLENVGKTLRHHTFFEMLGNFSFGDYFKHEACKWALIFSRDVMKLDMSKVWVTYHKDDEETAAIWRDDLGYPSERIVPLGDKDNWWGPAGETGACGPCSELHYDLGESWGTGPEDKIGGDTDRYLEYWNMVFPQFDQQADGSRPPLKNRGIDTGLGLARLALIKQGASSPYTIDAMWPITKAVTELTGVSDYAAADRETQLAVNAIADHIRALTFVMSEGVTIGNTDRGYVLKRILRRAARFGRKLGVDRPFIHTLVPVVVDTMGHIYPEIKDKPGFIAQAIKSDEENFHRTMEAGMGLLESQISELRNSGVQQFPGDVAFHLWETSGFPMEDTREIAGDEGFSFDEEGFHSASEIHKMASAAPGMSSSAGGEDAETHQALLNRHGASKFVGYEMLTTSAGLLAIVQDGKLIKRADEESGEVSVVLDTSPFYAESGGQVGDRGTIRTEHGTFAVANTTKTAGGVYLHRGRVVDGYIQPDTTCKPKVDETLRGETERNHSATHLMQGALKRVLGSHVTQSGSLVNEKTLRFDFTHLKAMTPTEIREVEEAVNRQIRLNAEVDIQVLPEKQASSLPGVIAPFDERYGDEIRVVSMGERAGDDEPALTYWDVEYCGGTHVKRTGDIGIFVIKNESSISQGVRRIEGLTGEAAESYLMLTRDTYRDLSQTLSVDGARVVDTIHQMLENRKELERQVRDLKKQLAVASAGGGGGAAGDEAKTLDSGIKLLVKSYKDIAANELRTVSQELMKKLGGEKAAVVLASDNGGKAAILVSVSPDLIKTHPAGQMIRTLAGVVGGGGGGKPDFAQAGGKDASKIPDALAKAEELFSA